MILMALVVMSIDTETRCEARACADPADAKKQLYNLFNGVRLYNARGLNTFNIIPAFRKSLQNNFMTFKSKLKRQYIHGGPKCNKLHVKHGNVSEEDVRNMSATCPWHVKLDYDTDRLPIMMAKAECTCRRCVHPFYGNSAGKCEKVESFVSVIRRKCVRGFYKYFATVESVPVGCTCVRYSKRKKIISPI